MLKSCQSLLAFSSDESVGLTTDNPFVCNVAKSASYRRQNNTRVTGYPRKNESQSQT